MTIRSEVQPVSTVGSQQWLEKDAVEGVLIAATQEQCQSSCSSGNGGCSPGLFPSVSRDLAPETLSES